MGHLRSLLRTITAQALQRQTCLHGYNNVSFVLIKQTTHSLESSESFLFEFRPNASVISYNYPATRIFCFSSCKESVLIPTLLTYN